MEKQKKHFQSVRFKLFLTMCVTITIIVLCLVIINSVVLGSFYMYSKTRTVRNVYNRINAFYNNNGNDNSIEDELRRIAFNNSFDIFNRKYHKGNNIKIHLHILDLFFNIIIYLYFIKT